ncbi:MAG: hypothetical protein ACI9XO_001451 [Paraglaciecola sp.]|jgi:hypothetical protein
MDRANLCPYLKLPFFKLKNLRIMKSFRLLISTLAIAIFATTNLAATNITDNKTPEIHESAKVARATYKELRSDVTYFVQNPKLKQNNILQEDVMISFIVNKQNRIELTNIDAKSSYLKRFVKSKLDRQEVRTENIVQGRTYNIKVSFIQR